LAKKIDPTPELIEGILARVPEGFIKQSDLKKRVKIGGKRGSAVIRETLERGNIGRIGNTLFDASRISAEEVGARKAWSKPDYPHIHRDGSLPESPITERIQERAATLAESSGEAALALIVGMEHGYSLLSGLNEQGADPTLIEELVESGVLKLMGDFVYDPLRISEGTAEGIQQEHEIAPIREQITAMLEANPGKTIPRDHLYDKFGAKLAESVINGGGFSTFNVKMKVSPYSMVWVRLKGSDMRQARAVAEDAVKIPDEAWEPCLDLCGDVLRPGARDGKTRRMQVVARTYTVKNAARRLALHKYALDEAVALEIVPTFTDPEETARIPAAFVEQAMTDVTVLESIAAFETVSARDMARVSGLGYSSIRRRMSKIGISGGEPTWVEVRGHWGLPEYYADFQTKLIEVKQMEKAEREAYQLEQQRLLEEAQEEERRQREMLRERLVDAFPTWKHDARSEQHISLHVGPPNSGKTHDSLEALVEVGSGWYLAPLRLLAFEIFDRLNQRGVPCNLLTGEEHIPVEGARITAATIEMLNPAESGECVIIDEAQMLADPDRGWAWTRALMEAEAPEIHVIGPPTVETLVKRMAIAGEISCSVIQHQRLAPIKVADRHWELKELPPHTILVAFSRRMVLHLKTELEAMNRSVSVIYGGLPPEVRRKQADRFASGETEICVATDAVGMGLNLPADCVCFYEIDKFDGYQIRQLRPEEVHQIGGRAGRYGIRQSGLIGAITPKDLDVVNDLFNAQVDEITHAHHAPSVEDLEILPGSLWERLEQWARLQSIPETLRDVIKTADLTERIELARMLTDEEVEQLGLAAALKLVNAPTRQSSRSYWHSCAKAILGSRWMPLPPEPPKKIRTSRDLETTEACIACADIYLWLAGRREFGVFAYDEYEIRLEREAWSMRIDDALLRKIDTARRCAECGRPLPLGHRHRMCDSCFYRGRGNHTGNRGNSRRRRRR